MPHVGAYTASKFASVGFYLSCARTRRHDIDVSLLVPGTVAT
ncbi:hypothetical protein HBB16_11880 [Pseudonocardia sp. MCCB 268]|nr:hypothetical protein [Pseudonocardia cytotoxica]